jgi:hypothetical protein
MKEKFSPKKTVNLMDLRAVIVQLHREISEDICGHVNTNIGPCLQEIFHYITLHYIPWIQR